MSVDICNAYQGILFTLMSSDYIELFPDVFFQLSNIHSLRSFGVVHSFRPDASTFPMGGSEKIVVTIGALAYWHRSCTLPIETIIEPWAIIIIFVEKLCAERDDASTYCYREI